MRRSSWSLGRLFSSFGSSKKSKKGHGRKYGANKNRSFSIEPLEERTLLSVCTWDGGGSDDNWTTAANWIGDVAPSAGDELVFDGETRTDTNNDYTADTEFASITIDDDDFTLDGNSVELSGDITVASGVTGTEIALDVELGASIEVDVVDTTLEISGVISGSYDVTKTGNGTLSLSGTNSYTNGTIIEQGTISFSSGGLATSGAISLDGNSSILTWDSGNTQDISSRLAIQAGTIATLDVGDNTVVFSSAITNDPSTPGTLIKSGSGSLSLTGGDRFESVTISAGELEICGINISTLSYGNISNSGTLVFNSSNDIFVGGVISGEGNVVQQGTGTIIFTGTNTFSGGTTISSGTLIVGTDGSAATSYSLTAQLSSNVEGKLVTFIDDTASTVIGGAVTDSSGVASIIYSLTEDAIPGDHTIRAVYDGSSQSGTLNVTTAGISEWLYRKQITISNTNVDEDLTDFPLYVEIDSDSDIGSAALSNGYDIRFTASDGTTLLDYERESWSGGDGSPASGSFWVKVPTVGSASATTIYIYYGKANAADGQDPEAVWDENYKGVYHFGTSSVLSTEDSTSTGNDGVNNGAVAATGEIGGAACFDGTYIVTTENTNISGAQSRTLEAWVQYDTLTNNFSTTARMGTNDTLKRFALAKEWSTYSNKFAVWVYKTAPDVDGTTSPSADTWYHLVATYDGTTVKLYVNGILEGSQDLTLNTTNTLLYFGDASGTNINLVDEARLSNVARSAAWAKFEYYNIASGTNELSWANEESYQNCSVYSLTLTPSSTSALTTATLTAQLSSELAGRTIYFYDDTASTVIGGAVTDASGVASIIYTLTEDAIPGDHTIRAVYDGSSQSGTLNVTTAGISEWLYRKQITISNTNVDEDLTNFPLYVEIDSDSDIGSAALSNGYDIRFTASDGTTLLDYEREWWSGGDGSPASGSFWVKVPTVGSASATTIYIYYGKANAADGQDPEGVWDENYKGVYHFGTSSVLSTEDSTSTGNDGVNNGAVAAAGEIGGAACFNGTNIITSATTNISGAQARTIEAWVQYDTLTNNFSTTMGIGSNSTLKRFSLAKETSTYSNKFAVWVYKTPPDVDGTTSPSADTWYHLVATYNGTTVKLYVNGILEGSQNLTLNTTNSTLYFGDASGTNINLVDEARLSNVARSAAWTKFEYYNIASGTNELSWANEESNPTSQAASLASFAVAPSPAAAGMTITLTSQLSSDLSGETITFTDESASITIGTAQTNGDGIATINYILPGNATNDYTLKATYGNSSCTITFDASPLSVSSLIISSSPINNGTLGSGNVVNNSNLIFNRSDEIIVSNIISGTGNVSQRGFSVLTLSGTNEYSGGTTIDGGTLRLGNSSSLGVISGDLVLTTGMLDLYGNNVTIGSLSGTNGYITDTGITSGTSTLTISGTSTTTFEGIIQDGGIRNIALLKEGNGSLTLGGSSTFTGGTTISAGTIQLGDSNALGNISAALTVNGGVLDLYGYSITVGSLNGSGGIITDNALNVGISTLTVNIDSGSSNFAGTLQDGAYRSLALTKGGGGLLSFTSANDYSSDTTLNGGTLNFVNDSLGDGSIVFAGGTLQWASGNAQDISALIAEIAGGETAFIDTNGNDVLFAGALTGTGVLTKIGNGTLTLTGANSFSGGATISAGTLQLGNEYLNGSVACDIVNNSAIIFANCSALAYSGSISGSGSVTKNGTGVLTLSGNYTYTGGTALNNGSVILTGTLTNTGSTVDLGDGTGVWTIKQGTIVGGTISGGDSYGLRIEGVTYPSTLDAVTLNANAVAASGSMDLTLKNGLILNGTITLPNMNTGYLHFLGSQNLTGTGQVVLSHSLNHIEVSGISEVSPATLTVGATITIHGCGTISGEYSGDNLINQGTITGDTAGSTLLLNVPLSNTATLKTSGSGSLTINNLPTNNGTIQAGTSSGDTGTLIINGTWTNNGSLVVNGGTMTLGGTWSNTGSFNINDGIVNLSGYFTTTGMGAYSYTSGTINMTGNMTNTGCTLNLGSGTGVWHLYGTIIGGSIEAEGGPWLQAIGTTGTLDGVTLDADMFVSNNATLNVENGLTLNETITFSSGAGATILFLQDQSLTGTGQIVMQNSYDKVQIKGTSDVLSATLTVGSGITINGTGTIEGYYDGDTLINEGNILANGGTLSLGGIWSNTDGNITVNGGTLNLGGYFTTDDIGTFVYTAGTVNLTGTLNNTGDTLYLGNSTGVWTLSGTIVGGTISATGGPWLEVVLSPVLDGVTLNADVACSYGSGLYLGNLNVKNGLVLNSVITLSDDYNTRIRFQGSQSLTGTGQIFLPDSDDEMQVAGIDAETPATLTIGEEITIHGIGDITGLYSGDNIINEGTIQADDIPYGGWSPTISASLTNHGTVKTIGAESLTLSNLLSNSGLIQAGTDADDSGTLTVGGTWTNTGTFLAIGDAVLDTGTASIQGRVVSVSGTELRLDWEDLDPGTTYEIEHSVNGVDYTSIGSVTEEDNFIVTWGMQPNSAYNVRIVATNASGGKEIYDGGTVYTQDIPDTSGWYQINSITKDSDNSELISGMYDTNFTLNDAAAYAGSRSGATLTSISGLVSDGSTPSTSGDGSVKVYQVYRNGDNHAFTFEPDLYQPSFSVVYDYVNYTANYVCNAIGDAINGIVGFSSDPIRYCDGAVEYSASDINADIIGADSSLIRSWSNNDQLSANQHMGNGWVDESLPSIRQFISEADTLAGEFTVTILRSATDSETFNWDNGQYVPATYNSNTLVHDTTNHEYVWTDVQGNEIHFYDFSASTPAGRQGYFKSKTDAGGVQTYVNAWTANGYVQEVRRKDASGNDVESRLYTYSGDFVSNVQLRQTDGQGGWTVVQQVDYEYYGLSDPNGNLGDLKTATTKDGSGNVIDTEYYRYYTPAECPDVLGMRTILGTAILLPEESHGFLGAIKYIFNSESYARLCAAVGNPFTATDNQVTPYAQQYFEYDPLGRCTLHDIQATGDSESGGIGTFTYTYSINPTYATAKPSDNNTWQYKTIETLPDGNRNIIYCNRLGEVMLKVFCDDTDTANPTLSGSQWITYSEYDALGNKTLEAQPSAVTGYQVDGNNILTVTLASTSGLIYLNEYYSSTTANATTAGGVKGYIQNTKIKQGSSGTPVLMETRDYFLKTYDGCSVIVTASDTLYKNTDGSGGVTVDYSYTWHQDTVAMLSMTKTLPVVSTSHNGSGSANTTTVFYDIYGQPIWTKDAGGYLTYREYDVITGAIVKKIVDVDTDETADFTNLPVGWTTPADGGLHLITTREVDAFGRTVKETDSNGNVTYVVYDDDNHEFRTYQGWNSTTHTTTGPVTVYRADRSGNYIETLTFFWDDANGLPYDAQGRPTGTESLTDNRAVIQSLSRILMNAAGQNTQTREYFSFSGITYSTARNLGVEGVNYLETDISYGVLDQSIIVVAPSGSIQESYTDSLGRLTTIKIGTDNSPGTSNMVVSLSYIYDFNDVGDGNLTESREYFSSGGGDYYETRNAYDWRNRLTDTIGPDNIVTHLDYDNLGNVTQTLVYADTDEDYFTYSGDYVVGVNPEADELRDKTTSAYDELGRAYESRIYEVDQTTGAVGDYLAGKTWYDPRGMVVKFSDSNGLFAKTAYDSVGREVAFYSCYDLDENDTDYSAARNVTGDTVVEQTQFWYDAAGRTVATATFQRLPDDTTAVGALDADSSYATAAAFWYDASGRVTYEVDYGREDTGSGLTHYFFDGTTGLLIDANSNGLPDVVETTPPEPNTSDNYIVTKYVYSPRLSAAGEIVDTVDNAGRVYETQYDLAGRIIRSIENYDNGTVEETDTNRDATVEYQYDAFGRMAALVAYNPKGSGNGVEQQTTKYLYTSAFNSSWQTAEVSPDSSDVLSQDSDGAWTFTTDNGDHVSMTYDRMGRVTSQTDQRGVVHDYTFDSAGRLSADIASDLGSSGLVDATISRIGTTYDDMGRVQFVTSYSDIAGTTIVNQVKYEYDAWSNLYREYEEQDGAVDGNTPFIQYDYADGASAGEAKYVRLVKITYTDGREVTYDYGDAAATDDVMSRISAIFDDTDDDGEIDAGEDVYAAYKYLGAGAIVEEDYVDLQVKLSYLDSSGDVTGFDRFGRVADQIWTDYGADPDVILDEYTYTYDRTGNCVTRDNELHSDFDEDYTYDALNRLQSSERADDYDQSWTLDGQGNFTSFDDDGSTQTRATNAANEITSVTGGWVTPAYDAAGNIKFGPRPGDETTGMHYIYDAWNRLTSVSVDDGDGVYEPAGDDTWVVYYDYDGANRRIAKSFADYTSVEYYYNQQWQIVEERFFDNESAMVAVNQYVWSPDYVDSPIVRFHDGNADGDCDPTTDVDDTIRYYTSDANQNVTTTITEGYGGDEVEHYVYTAYGEAVVYDGNWSNGAAPAESGPLYCGYFFDAETGLHQVRNRYYDSSLSAFIGRDPSGFSAGDTNLYRYVGNSPGNYTDPMGLCKEMTSDTWDYITGYVEAFVDQISKNYVKDVNEITRGYFWDAPVEAITGTYEALSDIPGTAEGIIWALSDPFATAEAIKNDIIQRTQSSRGQGQLAFGIAATISPVGLAARAKLAKKAAEAAKLAEAMRAADMTADTAKAAKIVEKASKTTAPSSITRTNAQLVDEIGTRAQQWAQRKQLTGTPRQIGATQHNYARNVLDRYQRMFGDHNLVTERSFIKGIEVPYGTKGSTRLDVLDTVTGDVWDYKFGVTPMSKQQIQRIYQNGPSVNSVIPVYKP